MIDPGLYPELPESEYRSGEWSDLPSWSSVGRCVTASPLHARHTFDGQTVETDAMRLGTAIHCAALEPARFAVEYAQPPKVDRRTKAGKAEWAEWVEAHPNVKPLSADAYEIARRCGDAARAELDRVLPGWSMAMVEASVCSEAYGVAGKCRMDLADPGAWVVDLKSGRELTARSVESDCWRRGYAGQVASYRTMLDCEASTDTPRLGILWVCTTAPHYAALTWLSEDYTRRADAMAREAWRMWREADAAGSWAPPQIPETIDPPGWAE